MTIFRNYYEYAQTLGDADRLAFYDAILRYAFDGVEPQCNASVAAVFALLKPGIDRSVSMSDRGRSGGLSGRGKSRNAGNRNAAKTIPKQYQNNSGSAPQNNTKSIPNQNQNNTKTIADAASETILKQNELKGNELKGKEERVCGGAADAAARALDEDEPQIVAPLPPPRSAGVAPSVAPKPLPVRRPDVPDEATVISIATSAMGVDLDFARWWYSEMQARDWTGTDGRRIDHRNWRPMLKAWYNRRRPDEVRDAEGAAKAAKLAARVFTAKDWGLCAERCANCTGSGCAAGETTPPDKSQWPFPPEECKSFRAI